MSKLKEMSQTKKAKEQYKHPIVDILNSNDPITKEEIGKQLNIESDRVIRDLIAQCSMHYPVIATSNKKGYRRAKSIEILDDIELENEIEEVSHQINELRSRVACLKKRMKPLVAWLSVAKKKVDKPETEDNDKK